MQKILSSARLLGMSVFAGLCAASTASAQTVTNPALTIEATNADGTHASTVLLGAFTPGTFSISGSTYNSLLYTIPAQDLLDGGGDKIGRINSGSVRFTSGYVSGGTNENVQQILLNVNVTAHNFDTTFTFTTGVLSFTGLANALARATTTSSTLTDSDGSGFAKYTGLQSVAGEGWRTNYNGAIPGGSIWQTMLKTYDNAGKGSNTSSQSIASNTPIGATVSSLQSQWKYTVTTKDSFGFNSNFIVVPAPATLLAFGGLLGGLARRRR